MSNLIYENVLNALDAIFHRPQPHLGHGERLKFTSGLTNTIHQDYHLSLEDLLVNFRLVNRSKQNRQSESEVRQDIRSIMKSSSNHSEIGLPSVFSALKSFEVTGAEKHAILMLDPKNRPSNPAEDWSEIHFFATGIRCIFSKESCGECEKCTWFKILEGNIPPAPRAYRKDFSPETTYFDGYLVTAGDTEFYPNSVRDFVNSDTIFICEDFEKANSLYLDTDKTPTIYSSNSFTTALLTAQCLLMSKIKHIGLIGVESESSDLIRIQNMAREGIKALKIDCKISLVNYEVAA